MFRRQSENRTKKEKSGTFWTLSFLGEKKGNDGLELKPVFICTQKLIFFSVGDLLFKQSRIIEFYLFQVFILKIIVCSDMKKFFMLFENLF